MESENKDNVTLVVTPWEIKNSESTINYDKLVDQFGCTKITEDLLNRFEKVIKQPVHYLLKRGIFFAHRDLEHILDCIENSIPFYIYTGRGPSNEALHVGHLVPFMIVQWFQKVLKCPVVIQMSDDEKFLFKKELTLERIDAYTKNNIKEIIACGFDPELTFIFKNTEYIGEMYSTILELEKRITFNQMKGIYGFNDSTNVGCICFPVIQAAPCFPSSLPKLFGNFEYTKHMRCLVPCAIDQDPYFRMCRDISNKLNCHKPSILLSKFVPSLQGHCTKMSSSASKTAIYVTDNDDTIKNKVNKYAFSGGQATAELQQKLGANCDIDIAYQYLVYFLEDENELLRIQKEYSTGNMLTGEIKKILIQVLQQTLGKYRTNCSQITDDLLKQIMNPDRAALRNICENNVKAYLNRLKHNNNNSNN